MNNHSTREEDINAMKLLRGAISNLSCPAADQIEYLDGLKANCQPKDDSLPAGEWVDELALEFSDTLLAAKWRFEVFQVSEKFQKMCLDIDQLLEDKMHRSTQDFWTYESLRTSKEWKNLRELAMK